MLARRAFLAIAAVPSLRGDERTDALDAVAPLAAALSEGGEPIVLSSLPREPAELRENVKALMTQAQATSSIEVVSVGNGAAELDWYMELRSRETRMVVERRRATVKVRFRKRRLEAIEPASFFAPPSTYSGK